MIGLDDEGKLNDWDLCRVVDVDRSLEGPRTVKELFVCDSACIDTICLQGTWQFMSTRLLANPGARHTITDDLESHYFVLMWTALHWVKHNQPDRPGINMEYIFDHCQRPIPGCDDIVEGGAGKIGVYRGRNSGLRGVEFACKPFNELFWGLWKLFRMYFIQWWTLETEEGDPGEYPKDLNSDGNP